VPRKDSFRYLRSMLQKYKVMGLLMNMFFFLESVGELRIIILSRRKRMSKIDLVHEYPPKEV
jgi:hypothetical protein